MGSYFGFSFLHRCLQIVIVLVFESPEWVIRYMVADWLRVSILLRSTKMKYSIY